MELSPGDETYQLNLAVVSLNQRETKEGMRLLTALSHSTNTGLAQQATQILASAGSVGFGSAGEDRDDETAATPVVAAQAQPASRSTKELDPDH